MWFRNLQIYRLSGTFDYSPEALAKALEDDSFTPCGSLTMSSFGWVPPLGRHGTALTHAAAGRILLCARKEEKLLPATVIREQVTERSALIEEQQARSVGRKERQQIKDDVVFELMPKAFSRSTFTFAYIDPQAGWLVVDATTPSKAEELLAMLRRGVGKLKAQPPVLKQAPATVMTRWLAGEAPSGRFEPQDECELRDPAEEGGIVRCRHQDLQADEMHSHLRAGKQVTRLAVTWDERISCVLGADLTIKRLRFEDVVTEELEQLEGDDEVALFDAQFALMTLELQRFFPALLNAFGGEDESAY
jgi:recombination associated protein RdgC